MNLEFITLGGYGQFVWPAFIFTFMSCVILYVKTKKELQKQEKVFLIECKTPTNEKVNTAKEKKITKEVLSGSSI